MLKIGYKLPDIFLIRKEIISPRKLNAIQIKIEFHDK